MNEEIEYAEMLEIPVSTVNVVRKKRSRKRKAETARPVSPRVYKSPDLKESVIAQVNGKLTDEPVQDEPIVADAALFAESANSGGRLDFDDIPQRVDTVRLFAEGERPFDNEPLFSQNEYEFTEEDFEDDGGRYENTFKNNAPKGVRIALGVEFALSCALCGAIFLTNVFMPNSAINTFFRALDGNAVAATDTRSYSDFTLSGVINDFSNVQLTLSSDGVLSLQEECHVYPVADGTVSAVTRDENGFYTLKISHSDSFTGVITGLEQVYYAEGDLIKANVPVGYSGGETEVQVTMYSSGQLLNCFELTEENCLAWVENP